MAETMEQKLQTARQRERVARARTARLRRSLDGQNRKRQTQIKCTLGAGLLALADSGKGENLISGFRRWLDHYLTRPQDRNLLDGTVFMLDRKDGSDVALR